MTTLDTLSTAHPDHGEVADAALAMADFDAKSGNHAMALDWLGVAAQHRELTREYRNKKAIWENGSASDATTDAHRDAVAAQGQTGSLETPLTSKCITLSYGSPAPDATVPRPRKNDE